MCTALHRANRLSMAVPQWHEQMCPWKWGHCWTSRVCVAQCMWAVDEGGMWEWEGSKGDILVTYNWRQKRFCSPQWQRQAWGQSSLFKICCDETSPVAGRHFLASFSLNVSWTGSYCPTLTATVSGESCKYWHMVFVCYVPMTFNRC